MASNLRGAPLFLRPSVVRQLVGDIATIRAAVVAVPVLPIALVDRPRASEDPRLAKANDDIAELPVASDATGDASRSDRGAPTDVSAPVVRIQAEEPEPSDWPDALLPDHADPDLDRAEPENEQFEKSQAKAGVDAERDQAREASTEPVSRPAAGRSAAATSEIMDVTAGETAPFESEVCSRPPVKETGLDGMAARESVSPIQRALPDTLRNTAGEKRSPTIHAPLRNLGRHRAQRSAEQAEPKPGRERIRAMAEKLAAKRTAPAKIDYRKVAEAHRMATKPRLNAAPPAPTIPAPSREECRRCGIPGWKGCDHFLPCVDQLQAAPEGELKSARPLAKFTGRRQGIGASRL